MDRGISVGAKEAYMKAGFADYLSKPIKGQALEIILQKHLPPELLHRPEEAEAPASESLINRSTGLPNCMDDMDFHKE